MYQTRPENLPQIQIDEARESISSFEVLEEVDEPGQYYEDQFADQTDVIAFTKVRPKTKGLEKFYIVLFVKVRDTKVAHGGRLVLNPGYTYMVIFDNRHSRISSTHIKYEINIEKNSKKKASLNSRRYSQLSTGSKRTEMIMLVKEILAKDCHQKKLTIEEDRPPSQLSAQISASLSTSGFLVPRSSSPSIGTVEVPVFVHRSNTSNSLMGNRSNTSNSLIGNRSNTSNSLYGNQPEIKLDL